MVFYTSNPLKMLKRSNKPNEKPVEAGSKFIVGDSNSTVLRSELHRSYLIPPSANQGIIY